MPDDGAEHRVPITQAAWAVALEHGSPVRQFTSRKGQRHLSGLWWSATTGGHVGFESWLERDHLLNLDFDPTVVGIASQPFWRHWIDAAGKPDSHAPDFFARRSDGSAVVVDCRPVERRRPRDVAKFEATARACALAGWEYRLLGEVDALVTANLRWLAGSCNATRCPCHIRRRPAVIRGDAKRPPGYRRRLEREPSAAPAPLLGPGSSSRAPRWCRAAR